MCFNMQFVQTEILDTGVTSHYVIDQSMISIFDMKKLFRSEAI